jgi:glycosyltransferase involved in cell wall biosynthesis
VNTSLHLSHTDIESDSRILKEMASLSAAGYKVCGLGVSLDEGAQRSPIEFQAEIASIHLRSRRLTWLPRTLRHMVTLCELVGRMLPMAISRRANFVHCHDTLVLPLGVLVKLFTGAKLVYDAHELESDRNGLSRLQSHLTLWVEKLLWRFVDGLIVVSPSIQRWYEENIGSKASAIVLNSPVFHEDAPADRGSYLRSKFNIPADRRIFIYVGILGAGRGLDLITQAFTHPEVSSHVVFLGYGELAEDLKCLERKYANIHVHDAVVHSSVVPIVRSADFGLCLIQNVSLSDYYCLPNKLFEYCFSGIPVLASDFPDIRATLTEYGAGMCCSLEPEAVRVAIQTMANSDARFDFSDISSLSWQAQAQKLLGLYQRVQELQG